MVTIEPEQADGEAASACITAYFVELDRRFPSGFDGGESAPAEADELDPPSGVFLVVRDGGEPVGSGGLRTLEPGVGEIKRMWVAESARGRGVGRRLLRELEDHARRLGHHTVRLDTNATLVEARALYTSAGYGERPPYNDNPYAEAWYEKQL